MAEIKKSSVNLLPSAVAGGSNTIVLKNVRGCSVEINLFGAQVTSWKLETGQELLFTTSKGFFGRGKPIRGGIRICFPRISTPTHIEEHGFARNMLWKIEDNPYPIPTSNTVANNTVAPKNASADIILKTSENWNNSYEFRLRFTLGVNGDLMLTSRIRNTNSDGRSFKFMFAYQNYIRVGDISDVRIEGLETLDYFDNSKEKRERHTEQNSAVSFESEVDKIYLSTPTRIATIDHGGRFSIVLRKDSGLSDAVVWNPWEKMSRTLTDLGNRDFNRMVVVGAAAVEKPICLKPGEEWTANQILSFSPTSYNCDEPEPSF